MSHNGLLEVWGGLECSSVRIANEIRDQIIDTGHSGRLADFDLIARLGVETLRYPILWETVCRVAGEQDWRWHDVRMERLKSSGISPIAGLIHHGSGPHYCDVLDPAFPMSLARHAGNVARRYPWINRFAPINEPMTTARLCGLYGHWHPHGRDEATCFHIVVAECRAIAASMKEIRRVTANAKLIQTEDTGRVFAVSSLQCQANYENERRWLALDLLAGRVDRQHAFHQRLVDHGIDERHLDELCDDPCPPDILGVDHYLTSDRFLDDRLDRHPGEPPGGNGRQVYVDVAAPRAGVSEQETGFGPRINEAWERYGLPLALTEVHNGCTREEQLRWLMDGWNAANAARDAGIDIRAVSVWSLFGSTDWNSLLTRHEGFYEPGAFDIRFDPPRPTAIAAATQALARAGEFDHPVLARSGWWKRDTRNACAHPLFVTGSHGLDRLLADCCAVRRLDFVEGPLQADEIVCGSMAAIHAEDQFAANGTLHQRSLILTCHYVEDDKDLLQIEADHRFVPTYVVHAFLDLVIDGATGHFQVKKADTCGQYALEPLRRTVPTTTAGERAFGMIDAPAA